jgi:methionyl-tRNA synthetase
MKKKYLLNNQKFLIVSAMPTPNGRLHLGHISGPFLPMDVLKRRINRDQGNAKLISGSDVYESHVLLKAHESKKDIETVCSEYHSLIQEDLKLMNLSYDVYLNPLTSEHRIPYKEFVQTEFKKLQENEVLVTREEVLHVSKKYNDVISGCWIHGECPSCKEQTGNYQCENCFSFYNPQDLKNIHSIRENDTDLDKVVSKSFFVKIDKKALINLLKKSNLSDAQMDKIKDFFTVHKGFIRVTSPESWGIPVLEEKISNIPIMSFPYISMLFYAIYCARLIDEKNWFDKNADTVIVNAHGMDNFVPTSAGMIGLGLELMSYKTFDFHIPNYFLNLDGSKFSTSRNNAIWVDEIIKDEDIDSDYVRYYLTKKSPQFEEVNITKKDLLACSKSTKQKFINILEWAESLMAQHEQTFKVDKMLYDTFFNTLEEEQMSLSPDTFNISNSIKIIEKWFHLKENLKTHDIRFWLYGFSIFLYPVIPIFSKKIWTKSLNNEGEVSLAHFLNQLKQQTK